MGTSSLVRICSRGFSFVNGGGVVIFECAGACDKGDREEGYVTPKGGRASSISPPPKFFTILILLFPFAPNSHQK